MAANIADTSYGFHVETSQQMSEFRPGPSLGTVKRLSTKGAKNPPGATLPFQPRLGRNPDGRRIRPDSSSIDARCRRPAQEL